jgi:acyl-CoA thioesterase-1
MLLFSACLNANSKTILVLGDSLSAAYNMPVEQGWVALLSQKLQRDYPGWHVINSSITGDTTAGGLQRLPQLLAERQPRVVILELGGNDGLRGYPLVSIQKNLEKLITLSLKNQTKVLLLGMQLPPNYGRKYTLGFQSLYSELHGQYPISFAPFIQEEIVLTPSLMMADGIHPTAKAQLLLLKSIYPDIKRLLEAE